MLPKIGRSQGDLRAQLPLAGFFYFDCKAIASMPSAPRPTFRILDIKNDDSIQDHRPRTANCCALVPVAGCYLPVAAEAARTSQR
jgi:hypothetical protein